MLSALPTGSPYGALKRYDDASTASATIKSSSEASAPADAPDTNPFDADNRAAGEQAYREEKEAISAAEAKYASEHGIKPGTPLTAAQRAEALDQLDKSRAEAAAERGDATSSAPMTPREIAQTNGALRARSEASGEPEETAAGNDSGQSPTANTSSASARPIDVARANGAWARQKYLDMGYTFADAEMLGQGLLSEMRERGQQPPYNQDNMPGSNVAAQEDSPVQPNGASASAQSTGNSGGQPPAEQQASAASTQGQPPAAGGANVSVQSASVEGSGDKADKLGNFAVIVHGEGSKHFTAAKSEKPDVAPHTIAQSSKLQQHGMSA